jgi:hypothetical protein
MYGDCKWTFMLVARMMSKLTRKNRQDKDAE